MNCFHPLIARWFSERVGTPSAPQRQGWPLIAAGKDVLIAAPTGSGKTFAAFLAAIDQLFRLALKGELPDETRVVYVSPLKALGNDVQKNLLAPLAEIEALARSEGHTMKPIRVLARSGDTRSSERAAMVKRPPHILITTPESLYLYLTAERSRQTLKGARTLIVDEIHALARDKRGSHFALSAERLKALTGAKVQSVGLSATVKPLEEMASFLTGAGPGERASTVQIGHLREWDLAVETPEDELSAVATHEMWGQLYDRIVGLTRTHRTTLLFANTRRLAERIAHDLGQRLGPDTVAAHHGSMARELRLSAEERLKAGTLRVMVATASLELGIDIGAVDLVCQVGTPRAISVLLQRVGRAGHHFGGVSKGILFALTRDELVECAALLQAVKLGELDAVRLPQKPLDVLSQHIVSACAGEDWDEEALFALCRRAWPYRELERGEFDEVVQMLSEGVATSRGHSRVHLHRDRVNGRLKARKGARIAALTNAGAIPDTFNYQVVAEPDEKVVGTVDEDFAVESMAGDVFVLGSSTWRVQRITAGGQVRVTEAAGQSPNVPFWRGEAPSRTDELSARVGSLREELVSREDAQAWLEGVLRLSRADAELLVRYLRTSAKQLGALPSTRTVIAERFFDEAGGMQLIIHSPFGGRINRAWGLALRKKFCRTFDFELQAAASDDGILLSLGEQHSFPLGDIFEFLSPDTVEDVLTQAVLQTPMFGTRFRWAASRALALTRMQNGKRVPPVFQRARSDDLLAAVFPAQVGCQDNHGGGPVELPDHPLVNETLKDCLRDALDVEGLKEVLRRIRDGRIRTLCADLPEPSPLAHQLLSSQPYTYLDDAPLEERRARAVSLRRSLPPEDAAAFGALDPQAIAQVVADAAPVIRDAEELHDALLQLIILREPEPGGDGQLPAMLEELVRDRRAARLSTSGVSFLVAAERVRPVEALFPDSHLKPALGALAGDGPVERESALEEAVRGRLEVCGPTTAAELAQHLCLPEPEVGGALFRLESGGAVLRGQFRQKRPEAPGGAVEIEWCDRRLLQRIHRLTVGRLRAEIQPLSAKDFMRFLFRWHHLGHGDSLRGGGGLLKAISLLQGYEAPASAWESALLPARLKPYLPELLERASWNGEVAWGRLTLREPRPAPGPKRGAPPSPGPELGEGRPRPAQPSRNANITFVRREELDWLLSAARPFTDGGGAFPEDLSHGARDVAEALERRGASFFFDLVATTRRLPSEVEDALWELLAHGLVTADAVENLRVLQSLKRRQRQRVLRRGGPGRWSLLVPSAPRPEAQVHEHLARLFLQRYGIVWRDLVAREGLAPPWRELLYVYRRLEARGEIRGGRFLAGFAGEQFALPEAVDLARSVRRTPPDGKPIHVSAVDPLNLTGVVTPGPRVPSVVGRWLTYVDGVPVEGEPLERAPASGELPLVH
ncbi:MAG: DEAD/DEAH box helicase [Myxococcaceae bacterium]